MQVDSLERLVNGAGISDFKALALSYLTLLGYEEATLTDGRGDLGRDIQVWARHGVSEPLAVQISVQRNRWDDKAKRDALEVKRRLQLSNFVYLSTNRIDPGKEQLLVADLISNGISAQIIDCRAIASLFHTKQRTEDALDALGISTQGSPYGQYLEKPNLKEDLAYSYAFFGTDVETFREDVVERGISAFITSKSAPPERSEVEDQVAVDLGLGKGRTNVVSSRIDHMLQKGDLVSSASHLSVSAGLAREARAVRMLRSKQWGTLQDALSTRLGEEGLRGPKLDKTTDITCESAGALLLASAQAVQATVASGQDPAPVRKQIEVDLRRLENQIRNMGLELGQTQDLLKDLTELISKSDIGQTLLAGYLFVGLTGLPSSRLLQVLGDRGGLEVFLDASVAIPILASLLFKAHDDRFFERSLRAYERAVAYGVSLTLPRDYLEEAATHLIDAYQLYQPIRDLGEDLRHSKNAFVAHYASLSRDQSFNRSFYQYAQSFGLRETNVASSQFRAVRNRVMDRMADEFKNYGVNIINLTVSQLATLSEAQSEVAFTARRLGIERASRLLEHDARTVAALTSGVDGSRASVLCTWDRLFLSLSTENSGISSWQAMNASTLADLLSLASPQPATTVGAFVEIALSLDDSKADLASRIWDELVRIEARNLYDADLLLKAREFKDGYLDRARESGELEPLAAAWTEWKGSANSTR